MDGRRRTEPLRGNQLLSECAGQAFLGPERTEQFVRPYVVLGVDHSGGDAPGQTDWLGLLVDWVVHGQSPPDDLLPGQNEPLRRTLAACRFPG